MNKTRLVEVVVDDKAAIFSFSCPSEPRGLVSINIPLPVLHLQSLQLDEADKDAMQRLVNDHLHIRLTYKRRYR